MPRNQVQRARRVPVHPAQDFDVDVPSMGQDGCGAGDLIEQIGEWIGAIGGETDAVAVE